MSRMRTALSVHDELVRLGVDHDVALKQMHSKEWSDEEYAKLQRRLDKAMSLISKLRCLLDKKMI